MGSEEEHNELVDELYAFVCENCEYDDVVKEMEYLTKYGRPVGELDVGVLKDDTLYYFEVKSSENYKEKAYEQLERAKDYFTERGYNFYGEIIHAEDDLEKYSLLI